MRRPPACVRLAALCVVAAGLAAGCGGGSSAAVTSASSSAAVSSAVAPPPSSSEAPPPSASEAPPPTTTVAALAALPPELVGSWTTATWQSSTGYPQLRRRYVFSADGRDAYTLGECQSSTDCAVQASESGTAQVESGVLSLQPQTDSADGPRSWRYVIDKDPVVGDVRLNLALADGQTDIFYRD